MKRFVVLLICALCVVHCALSQELNCNLTISTPQIEGTNKQVFETLKNDLESFMN